MAEVRIRLLKHWQNGETKYPEGQLLEGKEEDLAPLLKNGTAELYEPKADDIISVSPAEPGGPTMTEEQVKAMVKSILDEVAKNEQKKAPPIPQHEYTKTGGFKHFAHFAYEVYKAGPGGYQSDPINKWEQHCKATGLSEGVNADGGFLVPTEFKATLLKNSLEASIIRQRAIVIPMGSNTIKIPIVQETTHSGSVYGGVIIYRPDEAGTKTASKPKFGNVQLTLHKLIGLVYATDELLEDSAISLEPLLTTMFSEAIAWQEDEDFINGTGAGMALGVLKAPCLVSVAKETGQAGTTIVSENIDKMWARLYSRGKGRSVWLANDDTWPELAKLSRTVGTGGSTAGLAQSIPNIPYQTILGRPLILTEHCQTLGAKGDIILGDWSQYLIGQRAGGGLKMDTSIHVKFVYDETAYRFVLRYDGQPWWPSALTPKHSTATLSPFVVLDART